MNIETAHTDRAPLLVDEPEARRLLGGICIKTLFNLRRAGELPFVKIGTRVMYDVSDLQSFIDRRKEGRS